jgi:hypothetical protein
MGPDDIPNVGRFAMLADPGGAMFYLLTPFPREDVPPPAEPTTPGLVSWHELYSSIGEEAAFAFYSGQFGWETVELMDMGPMGKGVEEDFGAAVDYAQVTCGDYRWLSGITPGRSLTAWPQPMRFKASPAPAAVASVPAVSHAGRPCKGYAIPAPYRFLTSVPSSVPKVAIAGSAPTAAPGAPRASRSPFCASNSLFCGFSVFPAPERGSAAGILVRPGTAPSTGAGVRSPIPSGSAPEPTIPLGPR